MEHVGAIAQTFDMLDIVLAVFFGCVFALWRGAGKKLSGLLSGAVMGGLIKPVLFFMITGAGFSAFGDEQAATMSPEDQKEVDAFVKQFQ
jgi:hypothetical protein